MKITYIGHSGFLAELEQTALLFDYYEGELSELPEDKALYVFASHRHPDHFNPAIFQLAKERKRVFYVLSADIWKSRVPEELQERTVHLKPNQRWEREGLLVQTLKSTDEGVAFLLEAEGQRIYHAGDLNDWQWAEEPESWNTQMAEKFRRYIEPLRGLRIDAAFVPLDPRQEEDYAVGMDYFLGLTANYGKVYPMHCWEDYSVIDRWLSEHPKHPRREQIVKITGRGQIFYQEKQGE